MTDQLQDVLQRLARLEVLVESRLAAIVQRLDAINGNVGRTARRLDEHEEQHRRVEMDRARWEGEVGERMRAGLRESESARWRLALVVSVAVSLTNLLVQLLLRLR